MKVRTYCILVLNKNIIEGYICFTRLWVEAKDYLLTLICKVMNFTKNKG